MHNENARSRRKTGPVPIRVAKRLRDPYAVRRNIGCGDSLLPQDLGADRFVGLLHTQSSLIDAFVLGSPRWLRRREHPHVFHASATALLSLTSTYRQMRNHQTR